MNKFIVKIMVLFEKDIEQNNFKSSTNSYNYQRKKKTGKMTSKELDEIEKMFKDIDDPNIEYTSFINKKRNNKKSVPPAQGTDPKNYYHDIQELLKNYSLDNDNDEKDKDKANNKNMNKKDETKKGKRGRKKKIIEDNIKDISSESNGDIDYLVNEKNDGYTKFKEFKELKKKMNDRKNYDSDEENDYDIFDD